MCGAPVSLLSQVLNMLDGLYVDGMEPNGLPAIKAFVDTMNIAWCVHVSLRGCWVVPISP